MKAIYFLKACYQEVLRLLEYATLADRTQYLTLATPPFKKLPFQQRVEMYMAAIKTASAAITITRFTQDSILPRLAF